MNFDLGNNNMNKLILLVVAGVALLLALNMYQNKVGKQVALLLAVVTIVVVGFFSHRLLTVKEQALEVNNTEQFYNYDQPENVEHFQGNDSENRVEDSQPTGDVDDGSQPTGNDVDGTTQVVAPKAAPNNVNNAPVGASNLHNSSELLPAGDSPYNQVNPSGVGDLLGKNLLNAGHHIGVNTQGCSMRNANRGLRSEPPNPQVQVSPWLQTTICPDLHRKSLDC